MLDDTDDDESVVISLPLYVSSTNFNLILPMYIACWPREGRKDAPADA